MGGITATVAQAQPPQAQQVMRFDIPPARRVSVRGEVPVKRGAACFAGYIFEVQAAQTQSASYTPVFLGVILLEDGAMLLLEDGAYLLFD